LVPFSSPVHQSTGLDCGSTSNNRSIGEHLRSVPFAAIRCPRIGIYCWPLWRESRNYEARSTPVINGDFDVHAPRSSRRCSHVWRKRRA
jgi:hypothetical protein